MQRFYSKFRIGLMTFAFGLASVYMVDSLQFSDEVPVDLPQIQSIAPLIVYPETDKFFYPGGGGHIYTNNQIQRKTKLQK